MTGFSLHLLDLLTLLHGTCLKDPSSLTLILTPSIGFDDVVLPPWAKDARNFLKLQASAPELDHVATRLTTAECKGMPRTATTTPATGRSTSAPKCHLYDDAKQLMNTCPKITRCIDGNRLLTFDEKCWVYPLHTHPFAIMKLPSMPSLPSLPSLRRPAILMPPPSPPPKWEYPQLHIDYNSVEALRLNYLLATICPNCM